MILVPWWAVLLAVLAVVVLVAALLGRRLSHAMLSIGAGVTTACCIVALLCKGIIHIAGL